MLKPISARNPPVKSTRGSQQQKSSLPLAPRGFPDQGDGEGAALSDQMNRNSAPQAGLLVYTRKSNYFQALS